MTTTTAKDRLVQLGIHLHATCVLLPGVIGLAFLAFNISRTFAEKPAGFVSLSLSDPLVLRNTDGTRIQCQVHLDNATGTDLVVKSHFYSAFDGMEIVLTDENGAVIAQQAYTHHQSPYSADEREFILKQGKTSAELLFPLTLDLAARNLARVRLRVVGTLPGSGYHHVCSTETAIVDLSE